MVPSKVSFFTYSILSLSLNVWHTMSVQIAESFAICTSRLYAWVLCILFFSKDNCLKHKIFVYCGCLAVLAQLQFCGVIRKKTNNKKRINLCRYLHRANLYVKQSVNTCFESLNTCRESQNLPWICSQVYQFYSSYNTASRV